MAIENNTLNKPCVIPIIIKKKICYALIINLIENNLISSIENGQNNTRQLSNNILSESTYFKIKQSLNSNKKITNLLQHKKL